MMGFFCDIDGVIAGFIPRLLRFMHQHGIGDTPSNEREWGQWDHYNQHGKCLGEFEVVWNNIMFSDTKESKDFWLSIPLYKDAKTFLKNFPTYKPNAFITSRIINKEWTYQWMEENVFCYLNKPYPDIIHSGIGKHVYLREGDFLIDDDPLIITECINNNKNIIRFKKSWNENCIYPKKHTSINSLLDIL